MTKKVTPKKSEWKPLFLEHLRETANVSSSAREAGVARQVAYKERDNSEAFRDAWDDAIEEGLDYLEAEARRRAYEGTLKPVYQQGVQVGEIREYSDTLTIFLLKGRRPEVFSERIKQEHTGKDGGPIQQDLSPATVALLEEMAAHKRGNPDTSEARTGGGAPGELDR